MNAFIGFREVDLLGTRGGIQLVSEFDPTVYSQGAPPAVVEPADHIRRLCCGSWRLGQEWLGPKPTMLGRPSHRILRANANSGPVIAPAAPVMSVPLAESLQCCLGIHG